MNLAKTDGSSREDKIFAAHEIEKTIDTTACIWQQDTARIDRGTTGRASIAARQGARVTARYGAHRSRHDRGRVSRHDTARIDRGRTGRASIGARHGAPPVAARQGARVTTRRACAADKSCILSVFLLKSSPRRHDIVHLAFEKWQVGCLVKEMASGETNNQIQVLDIMLDIFENENEREILHIHYDSGYSCARCRGGREAPLESRSSY